MVHKPNPAQTRFSEDLQLLHLCNLSEYCWPYRTKPWTNEQKVEARLLDAITLFIGGQSPGCDVAAALDRRNPVSVVLAKNGTLTERDKTNAARFFEAVCIWDTYIEIRDFVLTTSTTTIWHRCKKIATTDVQCIRECLRKYEPGPVENEFDGSHPYLEVLKSAHSDTKEILGIVIDRLQSLPVSGDSGGTQTDLDDAINLAAVIINTPFLTHALRDPDCAPTATKYKRRLEKLAQYQSGILLILRARRRFTTPGALTIPHRWVVLSSLGLTLDPLGLSQSPLPVAQRSLPVTAANLITLNSGMFDVWADTVNPVLHPELLIVVYFHMYVLEHNSTGLTRDFTRRTIGCSRRTCCCCDAWINGFNQLHQVRWETSQNGGKSFRNWALSGVPVLDESVIAIVTKQIRSRLQKFSEPELPMGLLAELEAMDYGWDYNLAASLVSP